MGVRRREMEVGAEVMGRQELRGKEAEEGVISGKRVEMLTNTCDSTQGSGCVIFFYHSHLYHWPYNRT